MKKVILIGLLCLLFGQIVNGQDYPWVRFEGGQGFEKCRSIERDINGNVYFSMNHQDGSKFDGKTVNLPSWAKAGIMVNSLTADGDARWSQKLYSRSQAMQGVGLLQDTTGRILLYGYSTDTVFIDSNRYCFSSNPSTNPNLPIQSFGFIIAYDTLGKVLEYRTLFDFSGVNGGVTFNYFDFKKAKNGNVFILANLWGDFNLYTPNKKQSYTNPNQVYHVFQFTPTLDSVLRCDSVIYTGNIEIPYLVLDDSSNVYMPGSARQQFSYAGKTTPTTGNSLGVMLKMDKNGNEKDLWVFPSSGNKSFIGGTYVVDEDNIYMNGYFEGDSIKIGNTWQKPHTPGVYFFFTKLNKNGNPEWFNYSQLNFYTISASALSPVVTYTDSIFYVGAPWFGAPDSISINGANIPVGGNVLPNGKSFGGGVMFKMDQRGNVLWIVRVHQPIADLVADPKGFVYFCGEYQSNISFDIFKSTAIHSYDAYVGKITDYMIFRGDVKSGPYCAGDTLDIPYTIQGEYREPNEFIAELSDEEGNFYGGERELGRIKTTDSGVIKAVLPLFQVASSNEYRIRIRSTNPPVQSFYRRDSLKLLIYSRDTANAGPDRLLCQGDTLELKTYGGTEWRWTPGHFVSDSNYWKVAAFPDTTTEFKVTIADSSGCGVNDTDYVKVIVRPPLKIDAPFQDSVICPGATVSFKTYGFGGDTQNHEFYWYELSDTGYYHILTDSVLTVGCAGDCAFKARQSKDPARSFMAVLWDSCSREKDSLLFKLYVTDSLVVKVKSQANGNTAFIDTILCAENAIKLFAEGTGGNGQKYFTWTDSSFQTIATGDSAAITPDYAQNYHLIYTDSCSNLSDTAHFFIDLKAPLAAQILNHNLSPAPFDSLYCLGTEVNLKGFYSGGDSTNYQHYWVWGDDTLSQNDELSFILNQPDTSFNLYYILKDKACTQTAAKDTYQINVWPELELSPQIPDTVCFGDTSLFYQFSSGGNGNYAFEWIVKNLMVSNLDSFSDVASRWDGAGNKMMLVVLTDNCTQPNDTSDDYIFIRPELDLTLKAEGRALTDTLLCRGQSVFLKAQGNGGINNGYTYQWLDAENTLMGTSDSILLQPDSNTTVYAVLWDSCTSKRDTVDFNIYLNPPLSGELLLHNGNNPDQPVPMDTAICFGQHLVFGVNSNGGNNNYIYEWSVNNQWVSNNDSLFIQPQIADTTLSLQLILKDNCTTKEDTLNYQFKVKPALTHQTQIKDTVCVGESVKAYVMAQGGDTSRHLIQWFWDGDLIHSNKTSNDSLNLPFISDFVPGNHQLITILSDGCSVSDTQRLDVFIRDSIQIQWSLTDTVCWGQEIIGNATANGGLGNNYSFEWTVNGTAESIKNTLTFASQKPNAGSFVKVEITVSDGCSVPSLIQIDSTYIRPEVQADILIDSKCENNRATIEAIGNGGDPKNYAYQWFINDIEIPQITDSIQWATDTVTHILLVVSDGCSAEPDTVESILPALLPKVAYNLSPLTGCEPLAVNLEVININNTQNDYEWVQDETRTVVEGSNTAWILSDPGNETTTYNGELKVTTNNNCTLNIPLPAVTVYTQPQASFNWNPKNITVAEGPVSFINTSILSNQSHWYIDTTWFSSIHNPEYTFTKAKTFNIQLIIWGKDSVCSDTLIQTLKVEDLLQFQLPNAFTPNGNGINDVFKPVLVGDEYFELQVYNRWGEKIFVGNKNQGWNGKYKGTEVQSGVYLYSLKVVGLNGRAAYQSGVIHLVK